MNPERAVQVRMGLGLGVIALTLLLLPLGLNWVRGGAGTVGVDPRTQGSDLVFAVTWAAALDPGPLDGRLVLVVARDSSPEPRFRVEAGPDGQQVFGMDVRGWRAGTPLELTDSVFGFPLPSTAHIPPGDYWVQAVLDRYRPLRPGGGPQVHLPARESGLPWYLGPGNLVSRPIRVRIDPRSDDVIRVDLSRLVPEQPEQPEEPGLERVRVPSELLSAFWGTEVVLEASVRLPEGWAPGPDARYPVVVAFAPRGAALRRALDDARGTDAGAGARGVARPASDPVAALVVEPGGGSPYFPGFLAVDSESLGPWADALRIELLPEVERRFGGAGRPGARALYGAGSGGGWAALAALLSHPDAYAGLWAPCLDPSALEDLAGARLHGEGSAYVFPRSWGRTPRPGWGHESAGPPSGDARGATLEQENHLELVLGSNGRSGGWWDAWQAAYSPRGEDGYPRSVWDKRTGEVDPAVAAAWRARPDLARLLAGEGGPDPELLEKLHLGAGTGGAPGPAGDACGVDAPRGVAAPPPGLLAEIGARLREPAAADGRSPGG